MSNPITATTRRPRRRKPTRLRIPAPILMATNIILAAMIIAVIIRIVSSAS